MRTTEDRKLKFNVKTKSVLIHQIPCLYLITSIGHIFKVSKQSSNLTPNGIRLEGVYQLQPTKQRSCRKRTKQSTYDVTLFTKQIDFAF